MRDSEILKRTTNRSVFNKLYKKNLEQRGKIRCSICGYHLDENDNSKFYGVSWMDTQEVQRPRYPSWKLVSKKPKQWMKKPLKIKRNTHKWWRQVIITW